MKFLRVVVPALGLVGVMATSPVAASADSGEGNLQKARFSDSHTQAFVDGSRAALVRSEDGDLIFLIHATKMLPGAVTARVFVYGNPAACSGHFTAPGLPGGRCGGPALPPAACAAPGTPPFDSCNPATKFSHYDNLAAGTATPAGVDNYILRVRGVDNAAGAEVQLYLSTLNQPYLSGTVTKYPKAQAEFPSPSLEGGEVDADDPGRDGGQSQSDD